MQKQIIKKIIYLTLVALTLPIFVLAVAPVVLTQNATNITPTSADLNGEITDNGRYSQGYYNSSTIWFEYGKTLSYGATSQSRTIEGKTSFTQNISGLSACSIYHFRAVAENPSEKAYGVDKVFNTPCQVLAAVELKAQNLTTGDGNLYNKISAKAGDRILLQIVIESAGLATAKNITVESALPNNIIYANNLKVGGVSDGRNITQEAISIGDLAPKESKTITFEVQVGPSANLPTGLNTLLATTIVYTTEATNTASCTLLVQGAGAGVAGNPTNVNTGIASTLAYSVLLPLFCAFLLVFLFRSKIIGLDKAAQTRKTQVDNFRAGRKLKKLLQKRK